MKLKKSLLVVISLPVILVLAGCTGSSPGAIGLSPSKSGPTSTSHPATKGQEPLVQNKISEPVSVVNLPVGFTKQTAPANTNTSNIQNLTNPTGCNLQVISVLEPQIQGQIIDKSLEDNAIASRTQLMGSTPGAMKTLSATASDGSQIDFETTTFQPTKFSDPNSSTGVSTYPSPQNGIIAVYAPNKFYQVTVSNTGPSDADRDKVKHSLPPTTSLNVHPTVTVLYICPADKYNQQDAEKAVQNLKVTLPTGK